MSDALPGSELPAGLLDARAYDHPTNEIKVLETHISWVVLTGRYAYKIKKPVDLGFLDFTTLKRRKFYCEEELRLNRRLSNELYIDVVPIGEENGSLRIGAEPACEYAVKMQQFGQEDRFDRQILNNQVTVSDAEALARRVAHFHGTLPKVDVDSDFGSAETVAENIAENFAQLTHYLSNRDAGEFELLKLRSNTEALLHRRSNAITERRQLGAVRECHGDLHARNVVKFRGEFIPYDCLEFDASLRCIDVINEIAFMAMDLLSGRRADLAYAFLNAYLETTGDYDGIEVLRLYLLYRCLVRAKVEAITDAQRVNKDAATYSSLTARYIRLAKAILLDTEKPWLIVMHGFSGSGKSWLADRLSAEFPAIRVRSDIERKRMHGLDALAASASGIEAGLYTRDNSMRTYRRLAAIAQTCLLEKFNAIIDAACLRDEQRMAFRDLARNVGARFSIVSCAAGRGVLEQRIAARADTGPSPSEAGLDVLAHQLSSSDPLTDNERAMTVDVATDVNIVIDKLVERIRRIGTS